MGIINKKSKVIGGVTYTTTTFTAAEALVVWPRVLALLGDGLVSMLFSSEADERGEILADPKVQSAIMVGLAERAADPDGIFKGEGLLELVKDFLQKTTCDQLRIGDTTVPDAQGNGLVTHFDQHFTGRMGHLMEVCMFVGEANFSESSDESP